MSWRCADCFVVFPYDKVLLRPDEDCPDGRYLVNACPFCGGQRVYMPQPCLLCQSESTDFMENYCDACKEEVREKLHELIESQFTEGERKLLREMYD